ncbi:MAG: bifunctional phosphoribosyl-AMP cyclohydrolase/phosphoribosyl-ATP diphosphatase HisIE [Bacteroidales bacterium]|jgi:phosphoribosyl-ATP pyrophosphohydrolase/phosphoribosyl-AMP cyclohydrolase|nr:bifunctional phosphoribosyl-AMP cyclohydrolase/phosphoribosyl-ATP diphosphatase HisIE [Bacteroidales bacterium]
MSEKIKLNFDPEKIDFKKNGDGLVPAVIQDYTTLKVLMLGYMNKESFQKTLKTGKVTFYSRSRKTLWTKGETSNNFLFLKSIDLDCDGDTLLVKADPAGPTCHLGNTSCFNTNDTEGFIRKLEKIIEGRKYERPEGSYTVKLFDAGVNRMAQKVGEEAIETVIEAIDCNDERFKYEASDLIYHLLVLLCSKNMTISDIEKELYSRHK